MSLLQRLVMWEDSRVSAAVFLAGLLLLLACALLPALCVLTNLALALSLASLAAKLYVHLMGFLKKPCEDLLASLEARGRLQWDEETVEAVVKKTCDKALILLAKLRSLFLVHDFEVSAKFCFLLYVMSHLASLVNTLSVLVAAWVAVFTVPLAATRHRATLDTAARLVRDRWTRLKMVAAAPRQRKITRFAPGVKEK